MKKALLAAGAAIIAVASMNTYAYKVGVVDMQKVFSSPHGVQQIQSQLEKKFSKQRAAMMKEMKSFQDASKKLDKNKSVMNKKDLADAQMKLKQQQQKLQVEQAKYQQAIMTAQAKAMKGFVAQIKTAAAGVAKKDGLDAVFVNNSLLYAKDSKDVTSDIVDGLK